MSSGIAIADGVVEAFLSFKMKKNQKYLAFKISDDLKMIEVEGAGGTYDGPYSEFEEVCKEVEAGASAGAGAGAAARLGCR